MTEQTSPPQGDAKQWGPQQAKAIDLVSAWLKDKNGPQVFRLFGFAGSGKTTLAKHLAEGVKGTVLYAAFTGKACVVLRKKGCEGARTIHSLIYKPRQDKRTGKVEFTLDPDGPASEAALIIVDEVSMVNEVLGNDLLSYGVKVLVLGDPAQLPPVSGEGFFINGAPDAMITEIHRNALDSPIIAMSMAIREGRRLEPGRYGDSRVLRRSDVDRDDLGSIVLAADQVICGLNKSRHTFNSRLRHLKNLAGEHEQWLPAAGDRLVCLRNNRELNIFNGGLWEVERSKSGGKISTDIRLKSLDEEGRAPIDVDVHHAYFRGTEAELDWKVRRNYQEFTYGWALTCHKAQGSQFDSVALFDESRAFRDNAQKWLYTGVTRAAEKVVVIQ